MHQKGHSLSSNTISPTTQTSGTFKLAKLLAYPKILPQNYLETLKNVLCYVVKRYADDGLSVLIKHNNGDVAVLFGDWKGNLFDIRDQNKQSELCNKFISEYLNKIYTLMKTIKVEMLQLYIDVTGDEFTLVDIQLSLNKFTGPGMLRDVFNSLIKTQAVVAIEPLDDRAMEAIKKGSGNYEGDLIIKPSRFRLYEDLGAYYPHYVSVNR